ncbi:hypothetical protein CIPAW_02G040700 [Carya illinoinensis]|uniref:Uncharacterized protein n=1 Tax=Carya illinoinensis TaxID=32201 RepID=A0A8T1R984_CARIL|nr:hypothetical protein CIPAW_02G040700 [Carya illinoinensis]
MFSTIQVDESTLQRQALTSHRIPKSKSKSIGIEFGRLHVLFTPRLCFLHSDGSQKYNTCGFKQKSFTSTRNPKKTVKGRRQIEFKLFCNFLRRREKIERRVKK